jgi:hypothetical protein
LILYFKKFFMFSVTVLLCMVFANSPSHAKISPKAFKEVTKHFRKGKEYLSPLYGEIALEGGLIHNLRFDGNYTMAVNNNLPDHLHDSAHDAIARLTKLLFPSVAGGLDTGTNAEDSFGKYATPQAVAIILNFANAYRMIKPASKSEEKGRVEEAQGVSNQERMNALEAQITELKKDKKKNKQEITRLIQEKKNLVPTQRKQTAAAAPTINLNPFVDEIIKNLPPEVPVAQHETVNSILKNVQQSIELEPQSIYPLYTTEQLILAFFCEKFNDQKDIWTLMESLDDSIIVDKATLAVALPGLLTKNDVENMARLLPLGGEELKGEDIGLDEIFALANASIFEMLTPYKPAADLLSNSTTYPYNRKENIPVKNVTFQDCVEISMRHIMNLLLYDAETRTFDIEGLKQRLTKNGTPPSSYFKNLETFYVGDKFFTGQKPDQANDGSLVTRSQWNKVVGDLNNIPNIPEAPAQAAAAAAKGAVVAQAAHPIAYAKTVGGAQYELYPGFINFVVVFDKLLGGDHVRKLPARLNLDNGKVWLEKSLNELFMLINPKHQYDFNFDKDFWISEGELKGTIHITATNNQTKQSFSFDFYSSSGHAATRNLTTSQEENIQNYDKHIQSFLQTKGLQNPLWDPLWLITKSKGFGHPLYQLFKGAIADNNARIEALKTIRDQHQGWNGWLSGGREKPLRTIINNILNNVGWDDAQVLNKIRPVIESLLFTSNNHQLVDSIGSNPKVQQYIKLVDVSFLFTPSAVERMKYLPNVHEVVIEKVITDINFNDYPGDLSWITSMKSSSGGSRFTNEANVKTIKGIEKVSELRILDLNYMKSLESLTLVNNPKLEILQLSNSAIERISLEGLPTLRKLDFLHINSLKSLTLDDSLSQLKELTVTGVDAIEHMSLEGLSELSNVSLKDIKSLKSLTVNNNPALKTLGLTGSAIKHINLKNLPALYQLNLERIRSLESFTLPNMPVLRSAYFRDMNDLKTMRFDGPFPVLSTVTFERSFGLQKVEGLEQMTHLTHVYTPTSRNMPLKEFMDLQVAAEAKQAAQAEAKRIVDAQAAEAEQARSVNAEPPSAEEQVQPPADQVAEAQAPSEEKDPAAEQVRAADRKPRARRQVVPVVRKTRALLLREAQTAEKSVTLTAQAAKNAAAQAKADPTSQVKAAAAAKAIQDAQSAVNKAAKAQAALDAVGG